MNENILNLKVKRVEQKLGRDARQFCLEQIKHEYGYDYVPEWHKDLDSLLIKAGMYSQIKKGFFLAAIVDDKIVGTIGMRNLKYKAALWKEYSKKLQSQKIGSIWRTYTAKEFRGVGIASHLLDLAEKNASELGYEFFYLHTSWNKADSVKFWLKRGYEILKQEQNSDKTVHMIKKLQQ